jgi:glutamine synthetase
MGATPLTSFERSELLEEVRRHPDGRVKVAVADIDGVLRGKVVHVDAFMAAVEAGVAFNLFGVDLRDRPMDNALVAGKEHGFPDATARIDLATYRKVPWDDNVPFFLGDFVQDDVSPHPLCARQLLKRVLARAAEHGYRFRIGVEYEFFNFRETPESWAEKAGVDPSPITHGTFGYSLVRPASHREYFNALWNETRQFGIPLDALHTETGPGVYEAALRSADALEMADRAVLFKEAAKEIGTRFGIMPSFMAKWHRRFPGCSGHVHQSMTDGERNLFHDEQGLHGMSPLFQSYVAGQVSFLMELAPMFWPTVNSYKRLVEGFWAPTKPTWGIDNRNAAFRVLPGSAAATRVETRCPGADMNPYLAIAAILAAGLEGVDRGLMLDDVPGTGENDGGQDLPSAPRMLIETTKAFRKSALARDWFGDAFVDYFAATREWEWRQWLDAVTDWERKRYFEII